MKAKFGPTSNEFCRIREEVPDAIRLIRQRSQGHSRKKAIDGAEGVPRPQSIQYRAREASHLEPKLGARGVIGVIFHRR